MCCKIFGQNQRAEYVSGLAQKLLDFSQFGIDDKTRVSGFSQVIREAGNRGVGQVYKTHDLPLRLVPEFLDQNKHFFVFNIVRDFRDVLISRLMYNRYYLPTIGVPFECSFVAENTHLPDMELIRRFYGTSEMLDWLVQWKLFSEPVAHDRYVRLQYESLLDPDELKRTVVKLGQCLVPSGLPPERVVEIAQASQFQEIDINLKQDRKQREVKTAFCRKGIAGDFERFLTKHQSESLKMLMQ
jgi:hypothetical protein